MPNALVESLRPALDRDVAILSERIAKELREVSAASQHKEIAVRWPPECDVRGDVCSGFAVDLACKIAESSSGGNILVSRTVKDLVAGSGLKFEEVGVKEFDIIDGQWRLFEVAA